MVRKIKIKETHDDPAHSSLNSMKKNGQVWTALCIYQGFSRLSCSLFCFSHPFKKIFSDWAWNFLNLIFGSICIAKNETRKDEDLIFSLEYGTRIFCVATLHFVWANLDTWRLEKQFALFFKTSFLISRENWVMFASSRKNGSNGSKGNKHKVT